MNYIIYLLIYIAWTIFLVTWGVLYTIQLVWLPQDSRKKTLSKSLEGINIIRAKKWVDS